MADTKQKKRLTGKHIRARTVEAAEILKLLGNPQRLLITELLCTGEFAVSEIEQQLGIHQPTLSQQLGALREVGIIEGRRDAKAVIYTLADRRIRHLLDALRRIFSPEGLSVWSIEPPEQDQPRIASSAGAASFARVALVVPAENLVRADEGGKFG
jgi:DNA-binding transcriptional ArsR family regulator